MLHLQQPGLQLWRDPRLVDATRHLRACRDAGCLPAPIGPARSPELTGAAELLLLSIEVAANEAGASTERPELFQGAPDRSAQLLLLAGRGVGHPIHRHDAAPATAAEADASRRESGTQLPYNLKRDLLALARPVKHRSQDDLSLRAGRNVTQPLGLRADLIGAGPQLLQQCSVWLGPQSQLHVGEGSDVSDHNAGAVDVAVPAPPPPVGHLAGGEPIAPRPPSSTAVPTFRFALQVCCGLHACKSPEGFDQTARRREARQTCPLRRCTTGGLRFRGRRSAASSFRALHDQRISNAA